MTATRFISAEVVSKLVEGSYETLILRVQDLVEANRRDLFGGDDSADWKVAVHGTYHAHALVLTNHPTRTALRVHFERDSKGALSWVKCEALDVQVQDVGTEGERSEDLMQGAAAAILAGNIDEAARLVGRSLVEGQGRESAASRLSALMTHLEAPSKWRDALLAEKRIHLVSKLLGESTVKAIAAKYAARFDTQGTLTESEKYRPDVEKTFDFLRSALHGLDKSAREAVAFLRPQVGTGDGVRSLLAVSEDLSRHLQATRTLIGGWSRFEDAKDLARVCDCLSEALYRYELATLFVTALAKRTHQEVQEKHA